MHIGTGIYEGKEIKEPFNAEPFLARSLTIKEEIFTIIDTRVAEATVLDINDANGIFGIEALSRGAAVCLFVESDQKQADLVTENLKIIGIDPTDLVICSKVDDFVKNPMIDEFVTEKYDVIFFEIKEKNELSIIKKIADKQKQSGVMVAIYPNNPDYTFPTDLDGCEIVETREFDDKKVAILLKVNL
jgi:16S rRNA G966 N2-methylase RsmD